VVRVLVSHGALIAERFEEVVESAIRWGWCGLLASLFAIKGDHELVINFTKTDRYERYRKWIEMAYRASLRISAHESDRPDIGTVYEGQVTDVSSRRDFKRLLGLLRARRHMYD
jgi:hypothetical protein